MRGLVLIAALWPALAFAQDAGAPAPPPDPLANAREAWTHRLDRAQLDAAVDAFEQHGAALDAARARRFRAQAFELHRRPLERAPGIADLEKARAAMLASVGGLPTLEQMTAELAPAWLELAEDDVALAGWRAPHEAATLLREALAISSKLVAIDPSLDGASPLRLRAIALSALPPLAGGALGTARFEFERALVLAPNDLRTRVDMAARYAVERQDRRLFHALLLQALRLDAGDAPEQLLARARAVALLHRERELFRG